MTLLNPDSTIAAAKAWLRERLGDGASCPVCTQRVQLYKRKLNSGMVRALIQIYRYGGLDWVKVQAIPDGPRGGDYAKLRFWGLLESSSDRGEDGNASGMWRVTTLGESFLIAGTTVPSHVYTFNNMVYPQPSPGETWMVTARDALGDKFDFRELMNG